MTQNILDTEATLTKDVFFRSHVVELDAKAPTVTTYNEPAWPEYALVFDAETTLDPKQQLLLFGFYRVCRLEGNRYHCVEEGILYADRLEPKYLDVIRRYVRRSRSEVETNNYDEKIHLYSRSDFVESVLFNAIRTKSSDPAKRRMKRIPGFSSEGASTRRFPQTSSTPLCWRAAQ